MIIENEHLSTSRCLKDDSNIYQSDRFYEDSSSEESVNIDLGSDSSDFSNLPYGNLPKSRRTESMHSENLRGTVLEGEPRLPEGKNLAWNQILFKSTSVITTCGL